MHWEFCGDFNDFLQLTNLKIAKQLDALMEHPVGYNCEKETVPFYRLSTTAEDNSFLTDLKLARSLAIRRLSSAAAAASLAFHNQRRSKQA